MREIVCAGGSYDRTAALVEHRLGMDNTPYRYVVRDPVDSGRLADEELGYYDVCEVPLAAYVRARAGGEDRLVAVPVFPSRGFQHGAFLVARASPLRRLEELAGARVGIVSYAATPVVWARGVLHDAAGLHARDVQWIAQDCSPRTPAPLDPAIRVMPLESAGLLAALACQEVDAILAPPSGPRDGAVAGAVDVEVRHLLADYQAVEESYARQAGVFPILTVVALQKEVYQEHPWLARSVHKVYWQAMQQAREVLYRTNALTYTLPWMISSLEATWDVLGRDPWPYGLSENQATLTTLVRHLQEQALIARPIELDDLFLPAEWTNSTRRLT